MSFMSPSIKTENRDFAGVPVAKTSCSKSRGPGFYPWSGNKNTYALTNSLHAATSSIRMLQLRSSAVK